uniref:Reelin domain-containing protein n=1 Tax=Panagrellus redivivus TaxID=6233 RepID=A0A7E4UYZ3_PANRE
MPSVPLGLVALGLAVFCVAAASAGQPLIENSGFHCKSKYSMRLDRRLHGAPRDGPPPFELQVLDEEGRQTEYYEPGKIYTVRLIGYTYYRGLLMQARLCDDHGFVIGALRGGRFLETPDWLHYGIRIQECDLRYPTEDSVTHADDSRKFVTQVQWTTNRNIGNVQFMLTIAAENDIYWERYRPRGGFLQPMANRGKPSQILRQVFFNEKYALKFLAGRLTSSESKLAPTEEMAKQEEVMSPKPTMAPEAMEILAKMEPPEFWTNHDGEAKVVNVEEKVDAVSEKVEKTVEEVAAAASTAIPHVNDGEAVVDGSEFGTTAVPDKENVVDTVETSTSEVAVEKKVNDGEVIMEAKSDEVAVDRLSKSEEAEDEIIESSTDKVVETATTAEVDERTVEPEVLTSEVAEVTTEAEAEAATEAVEETSEAEATTSDNDAEPTTDSDDVVGEVTEGSADEESTTGELVESETPAVDETVTEGPIEDSDASSVGNAIESTPESEITSEDTEINTVADEFEGSGSTPESTDSDLLDHPKNVVARLR